MGSTSATASKQYVVDFDDLCDKFDPWDELVALKERFPSLKVTLFAIPALCSDELLAKYGALDWVELGVHGYYHSPRECMAWDYEESKAKLEEVMSWWPGAKLFKAPGWLASEPLYEYLQDEGWMIADNLEHADSWLKFGVEARYVYNANFKIEPVHGHTRDVCGNGPSEWSRMFLNIPGDAEFLFVSEALGNATENDATQHQNVSWSHNTPYGQRAAHRLGEFMEAVKPDGPIADFGGNDGFAAHMSGEGKVEVVDGNRPRIEHARSTYGLSVHCEDFSDMPFEDGHFTWGFTSHTLEHLPNMMKCWEEMKRVCRHGIWVIVPVESQESFDKNPSHHIRYDHQGWLDALGATEVSRSGYELVCKWERGA